MAVSAKSQINSIRSASADGEITPSVMADCLDAILTEASQSSSITLPEYLEKDYIEGIKTTAKSALDAANSASGCTCTIMSEDDFTQLRVDFGFIQKGPIIIH